MSIQDAWVIGLGIGIISGAIVIAITRVLFAKRERKDYLERVAAANSEISDCVRPLVGKVPLSSELVNSIVMSTAQKYAVERRHLHDAETLADDLIKEIMVTPLLSGEQKVEFSAFISKLRAKQRDAEAVSTRNTAVWHYDTGFVSATLGVTSAVFAMSAALFLALSRPGNLADASWIIAVATLVPLLASFVGYQFWRKRKPGEEKEGLRAIYFVDFKSRNDRHDGSFGGGSGNGNGNGNGNGYQRAAVGGQDKGQAAGLSVKYKTK